MSATVTLTVNRGNLRGKQYVFDRPAHWVIGRAADCALPLQGEAPIYSLVSRHHCLLDVNPPFVRVRDLGSLHGTFVNGELIGQRCKEQTAEEAGQSPGPERELADGDELQLWPVTFQIHITPSRR